LLVKFGPKLVETGFGHKLENKDEELTKAGQDICEKGIETMLELESPNLHELGLDRVIAFGHTWSPTLELTPTIPLRHGHAITVSLSSFSHPFPTKLPLTRIPTSAIALVATITPCFLDTCQIVSLANLRSTWHTPSPSPTLER